MGLTVRGEEIISTVGEGTVEGRRRRERKRLNLTGDVKKGRYEDGPSIRAVDDNSAERDLSTVEQHIHIYISHWIYIAVCMPREEADHGYSQLEIYRIRATQSTIANRNM